MHPVVRNEQPLAVGLLRQVRAADRRRTDQATPRCGAHATGTPPPGGWPRPARESGMMTTPTANPLVSPSVRISVSVASMSRQASSIAGDCRPSSSAISHWTRLVATCVGCDSGKPRVPQHVQCAARTQNQVQPRRLIADAERLRGAARAAGATLVGLRRRSALRNAVWRHALVRQVVPVHAHKDQVGLERRREVPQQARGALQVVRADAAVHHAQPASRKLVTQQPLELAEYVSPSPTPQPNVVESPMASTRISSAGFGVREGCRAGQAR